MFNSYKFDRNAPSSHVTLEHEIACVDVRVLKADSGTSNICAVGLWTNISAKVLRLPSFDALHTQPLGGGGWSLLPWHRHSLSALICRHLLKFLAIEL